MTPSPRWNRPMLIRADTPKDALEAVAEYVRHEMVVCENTPAPTRTRRVRLAGRRIAREDIAARVGNAEVQPTGGES